MDWFVRRAIALKFSANWISASSVSANRASANRISGHWILAAGLPLLVLSPFPPGNIAHAVTCQPLAVVDSQGPPTTKPIEKKVSPPGAPLPVGQTLRNNWNTDFVVEGRARRYIATLAMTNGGKYRVAMHLKYPNNTSDAVYDKTLTVRDGQSIVLSGNPRAGQTPYQVNVFVGGVAAVGNTYRISVAGCN
jgi:hypothetical protein